MEDDLKKIKNQKNLFSIPLKSRGKPFLGLAQLSKIFYLILKDKNKKGITKGEFTLPHKHSQSSTFLTTGGAGL
jgi:hypothetical protein